MNNVLNTARCQAIIKNDKDYLCINCYAKGRCKRFVIPQVTDEELGNWAFVYDAKVAAYFAPATDDGMKGFIAKTYRDYLGMIVDEHEEPIWLDTSELDCPSYREWIRDWRKIPGPDARPYVRKEAWERARVTISILKTKYRNEALFWGLRGKASNQNEPQD